MVTNVSATNRESLSGFDVIVIDRDGEQVGDGIGIDHVPVTNATKKELEAIEQDA